jgi:hypothetical protein
MDTDLISKKELLDFAGISYGQLYRWKRKGLIPEEWFIRRSTYTGQETFFPREKILSRIEKIKDMKEDISLDDLADVFSPDTDGIRLTGEEITLRSIAGSEVVAIYSDFKGNKELYSFDDMVYILLIKRLFDTGGVARDDVLAALELAYKNLASFKSGFCELYAIRKLGVFSCFMVSSPCEIRFDGALKVIVIISIPSIKEELKLKLL